MSDRASNYLLRLKNCLNSLSLGEIDFAVELIKSVWKDGKQVICFGNGGSALTAKHYIMDWTKGVYLATGKPFLGHCLADNIGVFSAYANDVSYQDVFVAQLKPILQKNDLVIGISGSGNSENVLRAIEYANNNDAITLGICGYDGGQLKRIAQNRVWVPVNDMQVAEDVHMVFGHLVYQALVS
jgi:D-sedoheptulose 7-phosphate isomerase